MDKKVIIEDNISFRKFFNKNENFKTKVLENIYLELPEIIKYKPHKIKTAYNFKYHNKTIYEYKIILDAYTNCRVAFIYEEDTILAFFISNIIIKREFVKLLSKFSGVTHS
ncbi:MAG: hypothetical protein ACRCVJ_06820 [Clostridium sp.]|uniref:hypothetical protein n=1 Tax=Clostridium sp. TaxID=1506 RepID=UPI003F2C0D25